MVWPRAVADSRAPIAVEIIWVPRAKVLNCYDCLFAIGNQQVHRTNKSMPSNNPRDSNWYEEERWAAGKLLELPAEQPVTIRFYSW